MMTLLKWFEKTQPDGVSRTAYAEQLAKKSRGKISMSTILGALRGQKVASYAKGKVLSDLTGGKVPVLEIIARE